MAESQQQLQRQQLLEALHEIVFQKFDALLPDDVLFACFCDIHERVEQLRAIQRPATNRLLRSAEATDKSSRQERLAKLLEWFKAHEGTLNPKLAVTHVGPGREDFGFVANEAVETDELLSLVPPPLCVPSQSEHVQKSALAWLMKSKDIPPNMCLVFWLITQKLGVDSDQFMRPYIDSLPVRVRHVIYGTPYSLRLLRDSFLCRKAILRYVSILRHYLILLNNVYSSRMKRNKAFINNLTFDLFRWASAIVQTRANTHYQRRVAAVTATASTAGSPTPSAGGGASQQFIEDIALCPVLDLFNHESGADKKELDVNSGCYQLLATHGFQPRQEVTMHYSTLSNPERFVEQGFWPVANPDEDQTIVPVSLPAHFLKELDNYEKPDDGGCRDDCCDHEPKSQRKKHANHQHAAAAGGEHKEPSRRNNVLQAYKVIREHLGANPVSYGTVGVLYLGAQARPHDSAKRVATFLCLSPEHQTILLSPEYQSADEAGHFNADTSRRFESMFASLCKEYPNLDRDAFIFLHKSIDAHIRDIKLHGAEPLPGGGGDGVMNTAEDAEEAAWNLSMNAFFEHAYECDMKFLERCLAHCKAVVRDLVQRSIEANRMQQQAVAAGATAASAINTTNGANAAEATNAAEFGSKAPVVDKPENNKVGGKSLNGHAEHGINNNDAEGLLRNGKSYAVDQNSSPPTEPESDNKKAHDKKRGKKEKVAREGGTGDACSK